VGGKPAAWPLTAPDPATIPEGPVGDAVRRGQLLVTRTREELPDHVGNGLHCTSCHLQGGTVANAGPWIGITGVFPEYRSRNAKVNVLQERVNDCFERSMDGEPLPVDGPDMTAIVAYMTWLSQGVPSGVPIEGRGFARISPPPTPDPERGKALYAEKCVACHGAEGRGTEGPGGEYVFPALWGDRSYNIGAGMARLDTAAAFVRWNMPLGQGGTLTDQDAYDVASFFIAQPRPDFARKGEDWPNGGKPRDARY
jgi:thiosulfate dehydrogenase